MFDVIAFDADDTLWHNEVLYLTAHDKFKRLLSKYCRVEGVDRVLDEVQIRNLEYYGYGIKGFALSMIEIAIELTEGQIQAGDVQQILGFGKEMTQAPVRLLEHAEEAITALSEAHELMLITKGDLFDQERKIARSGLADHFTYVEVVTEKTSDTYRAILAKHNIDPQRFLMVGNSVKSDVLPVLAIGGRAVHIPYHTTWAHEAIADRDKEQAEYFELGHIGLLPALVRRLSSS